MHSNLDPEDIKVNDDNLHDFCQNCESHCGENNLQEYVLHSNSFFICEDCAERNEDFKIVL